MLERVNKSTKAKNGFQGYFENGKKHGNGMEYIENTRAYKICSYDNDEIMHVEKEGIAANLAELHINIFSNHS